MATAKLGGCSEIISNGERGGSNAGRQAGSRSERGSSDEACRTDGSRREAEKRGGRHWCTREELSWKGVSIQELLLGANVFYPCGRCEVGGRERKRLRDS